MSDASVCIAGIPTIGVGKSLHYVDGLTREKVRELSTTSLHALGDRTLLVGSSLSVWGALLRTTEPADGICKPIIVSVGHGLSLSSALEVVCTSTRYRVPEPIRQADLRSREWLRKAKGKHR